MPKRLTVTIVIPVYNEADTIHRCLEAIAAQTVQPYEVIVVDNNSSDGTALLAAQFPFVRVMHEAKQGVVYARDTGFNAARGDIIGRIDADTLLSPDWVETIQRIFTDNTISAVSGGMRYHAVPFADFFSRVDRVFRAYLAWALGREVALQGANLAIRRSAWQDVRHSLCTRGDMHEDFDLSIHLHEAGHTNRYMRYLQASITFRQAGSKWGDYLPYVLLNPGTYAQHNRARRIVMYPVITLAFIFYPLIRVLYLGYDEASDGFSFTRLMRSQRKARVNPATYVD